MENTQQPLRQGRRGQRVTTQEPGQARRPVRAPRVVLHGAGAQGVELPIDSKISTRQPRKVPHHLKLGNFWKRRRCRPAKALGQVIEGWGRREQLCAGAPTGDALIKQRCAQGDATLFELHAHWATSVTRVSRTCPNAFLYCAMSSAVRFSVAQMSSSWVRSGQ